MIKKRVDWLIIGPRDYHIVVEIARFEPASKDSNGQLKFSLLGRGYTDNGTYHFNLNERQDMETRDRVTDVVVSESNTLRVEYLPGQAGDTFTLAYRLRPRVLVRPAGWLRQYFNEMTKPAIFVPRLTDQQWTIRAPYTKHIALYTKFLDLLNEMPCSKSSVNFYEGIPYIKPNSQKLGIEIRKISNHFSLKSERNTSLFGMRQHGNAHIRPSTIARAHDRIERARHKILDSKHQRSRLLRPNGRLVVLGLNELGLVSNRWQWLERQSLERRRRRI